MSHAMTDPSYAYNFRNFKTGPHTPRDSSLEVQLRLQKHSPQSSFHTYRRKHIWHLDQDCNWIAGLSFPVASEKMELSAPRAAPACWPCGVWRIYNTRSKEEAKIAMMECRCQMKCENRESLLGGPRETFILARLELKFIWQANVKPPVGIQLPGGTTIEGRKK